MLFLGRRVNIAESYISFLQFLHPHYVILKNIEDFDPYVNPGVIYTGSDVDKLRAVTDKYIIVTNTNVDVDLTTNEGLVKHVLPIHYLKLKEEGNEDQFHYISNVIEYDTLLQYVKQALLVNSSLPTNTMTEGSVYNLYQAIISTQVNLDTIYFNLVTNDNLSFVRSSILTFLTRVQTNRTVGVNSVGYTRLIQQSHKRYGKHIRTAVLNYLSSKSIPILALHKLLTDLNKAR